MQSSGLAGILRLDRLNRKAKRLAFSKYRDENFSASSLARPWVQAEEIIMIGFVGNIDELTENNSDFRHVLYTGRNLQLVLMAIAPGDQIGEEVHEDRDQFFRVEYGEGEVQIDGVSTAVAARATMSSIEERDCSSSTPSMARPNMSMASSTAQRPMQREVTSILTDVLLNSRRRCGRKCDQSAFYE
jgi:mannose-6-phosphate isomerase-like protein (cupin superfamily)